MREKKRGDEMGVGGQGQRKRAVIYLRVSSEKQVNKELDPEGLSLPSQRKRCEAHAEQLGAEVVREYVEPGVSASSVVKRKAFKQMLAGDIRRSLISACCRPRCSVSTWKRC